MEDTNEGEKDETNMEKEVEDMFAEKGWTVKMSGKFTKSQKVAKVLRRDRCDCCTSQSSRIISELANMVRRNSEVVKTNQIAGLDALPPCGGQWSDVDAEGGHNNAVPCVRNAFSASTLVGLYCKVYGKVHLKRDSLFGGQEDDQWDAAP